MASIKKILQKNLQIKQKKEDTSSLNDDLMSGNNQRNGRLVEGTFVDE